MEVEPNTRFEKATPKDAKDLALASWHAFDNDINYGAPGVGGPSGYKSDRWQLRMMIAGDYYRILANDRIIGGFVVRQRGYQTYEVVRIFVHPDYQKVGFVEVGKEGRDGILFEKRDES
jgi:hypothetical protein